MLTEIDQPAAEAAVTLLHHLVLNWHHGSWWFYGDSNQHWLDHDMQQACPHSMQKIKRSVQDHRTRWRHSWASTCGGPDLGRNQPLVSYGSVLIFIELDMGMGQYHVKICEIYESGGRDPSLQAICCENQEIAGSRVQISQVSTGCIFI